MVAWKLFDACRRQEFSSHLVVGCRETDDPGVIEFSDDRYRGPWARTWGRFAARLGTPRLRHIGEPLRWLHRRLGREDMDFPASWHLSELVSGSVDLVHAHNLHGLGGGYFDLRSLPQLSHQIPVLLTLHDAWLLAGHCAHSFDCDRWLSGCGSCPDITIPEAIRRDASGFNWRRKRELFMRSSLCVATPCQWLMDRLARSILGPGVRISRVIPHGVDLRVFRPGDKQSARRRVGLDPDVRVVLCLGNTVRSNTWRDFGMAMRSLEAAARNRTERVVMVAVGESGDGTSGAGIELIQVPHQSNPSDVAAYLQAADLLIHLARADTFPSVVVEAMACGIPVVATSVGGIPEQVVDGETGFLVRPNDVKATSDRIELVLDNPVLGRRLGRRAAELAAERFDFEDTVAEYLDFYGEILSEGS